MSSEEKLDQYSIKPLFVIAAISTLVLFFFSSLRHSLFQSGALDLGFFDQGIYLISQGIYPKSTIIDIHMLGDHAAIILYPLSLFYKIYPDIQLVIFDSSDRYFYWHNSIVRIIRTARSNKSAEVFNKFNLYIISNTI